MPDDFICVLYAMLLNSWPPFFFCSAFFFPFALVWTRTRGMSQRRWCHLLSFDAAFCRLSILVFSLLFKLLLLQFFIFLLFCLFISRTLVRASQSWTRVDWWRQIEAQLGGGGKNAQRMREESDMRGRNAKKTKGPGECDTDRKERTKEEIL